MIIILMGVAGSGKTTIGCLLSKKLNWDFYDGDTFHTATNIEKMKKGSPLDEGDREPWLEALRHIMNTLIVNGEDAVFAVSALTESFRRRLLRGFENVKLCYLKGSYELIRKRLEERKGHFFRADLLVDQFTTLEEPIDSVIVDIAREPQTIVNSIITQLGLNY